ncbi:MAG TPA: low molecular weight protein-tyrosine-phosphatase [Sphingomonadaceae bacterium]
MNTRPSVLFVCLGNICRSPLAEAAFRKEAEDAGLDVEIDSAGTGHWHAGKPPDPRAQAIALANGIDISHYRARQLEAADFARFSHIFAMDYDNLATIQARAPKGATAEIALLLDWVPGREGAAVADPYYGGEEHFEDTWADMTAAAQALVARFRA